MAEPFNTAIYVLLVVLFVCIVLWIIAQLLAMAGIHVPTFGLGKWGRADVLALLAIPV